MSSTFPEDPALMALLERYVAHECDAAERERVERLFEERPSLRTAVDEIQARLVPAEARGHDWSGAAPLDAFWRTVRAQEQESVRVSRATPALAGQHAVPGHTRWRPLRDHAIARRALLATVAGTIALVAVFALPRVPLTGMLRAPRLVTTRTYTAARAQRTIVTLPDGSNVVLAPETALRFTIDNTGARAADLVGEALFTVTSHDSRPFTVRTGAVTTRVLGTTFDVRRYPGEQVTLVAVVNGRVSAQARGNPVALTAGAVARLADADSSTIVSTNDDAERIASWTQGRLVFRNASVSAMLATLGRWYGYEFHLTDTTLASKSVSVGFRDNQVSETMNTLKALLGVTMTFDGNVVTLRPERNAGASPDTHIRETLRNPDLEVGK